MLVYFHIDELARDAVVAAALRKDLKQVGGRLVYGNRFTTDYILRYFNVFDAIILPSLRHFLVAFPDAKNLPSNVFILQTEAIGQATGTLRRLNGKYFGDDAEQCKPWHEAVKGFLLWGHAHLNPFREFYPSYLSKCRVVGHPRLSSSCQKPIKRVKSDKPVVGFVSRFNILSPFDSRTPFESVCSTMKFGKGIFPHFENSPDKDVEDMFYTEVIDFRVMLEIMMTLDPNKYELAVRPHPRENRMGWMRLAKKLNLNIKISSWDEPFGHWLQGLDFIVTPPSTSLYDAFYHGKTPIVTSEIVPARANHILTESDDNNQILQGVCRPKSVQEVISLIASGHIPFDKKIIELRLLEQVGADVAAHSTKNIINAISEMIGSDSVACPNAKKAFSLSFFRFVSLALSYARWFKGLLIRRVEQGCNFNLTMQREKWIDHLTWVET